MSILKNNIPNQRKGIGEHLSNQEWNNFINQLALQGNNHRDILANISDEIFKFEWVEYEQETNDNQIIKIPDNSLGTDVTNIEELKNYLNSEDSQYKANEWMYYIVEYKRGTRVFKLISKGVFFLDLDEISNFIELLDKKVDKEDGKTLTSNDFTDLLKTKLDGIEEGAEKNIDSDWFSQEGEKGFIKNKPTHMLASDVFPWAKKQYMDARDVPGLDTSKITEGVFDPLRIPNLPMSKTIGLETELTRLENDKVSVATFDMQMLQKLGIKPNGTDLLIINGMINPLYIGDTSYKAGHKIATSQSEMLSLQDAVVGTVVMRTDLNNELFILTTLPASVLANWQVASPNTVLSVAGRTGAVVLGITDIDGLSGALNLKLDATTFESEVTRLEGLINLKADDDKVVKKVITPDRVYGTDSIGNTLAIEVSIPASMMSVARRTYYGQLEATDAVEDTQLVPLGQLKSTIDSNLSQLYGGKNLASPDLEGKEYLGNGVYRLLSVSSGGIVDYNVYNGNYIIDGLFSNLSYIIYNIGISGVVSGAYYYVSGEVLSGSWQIDDINIKPFIGRGSSSYPNDTTILNFSINSHLTFYINANSSFNNFQFKFQIEQGSTPTPYTLPMVITPEYIRQTQTPRLIYSNSGTSNGTDITFSYVDNTMKVGDVYKVHSQLTYDNAELTQREVNELIINDTVNNNIEKNHYAKTQHSAITKINYDYATQTITMIGDFNTGDSSNSFNIRLYKVGY